MDPSGRVYAANGSARPDQPPRGPAALIADAEGSADGERPLLFQTLVERVAGLPGVEAVVVDDQGRIYYSDGLAQPQ